MVDQITGPIISVDRYIPAAEDPQIYHWVSSLADEGWARAGHPVLGCGGNALDDDAAQAAALGEALERAAGCLPEDRDVVVSPYGDVTSDAVDPLAWDLFHPRTRAEPSFPYVRPCHNDPISWVWGWSLTAERAVLVPAARVFVPFEPRTVGDNADCPFVSGFATGNTVEEAALSGLLEVIERDSFMIAWATGVLTPGLELDASSAGGVGDYVKKFESRDLEVRCSLIMLDFGVPVVIAMVRSRRPGDPATVVAASAGVDTVSACRHALSELTANRLSVRDSMARGTLPLPDPDPHAVRDETAHGLLYARPDMARHLDPWWDPPDTLPLSDPAASRSTWTKLSEIVAQVKGRDADVVLVDLTPPEIADLGIRNVKVLVPGAYPMNFDSRWPHFGGTRIYSAPVAAGLLDSPVSFEDLNRVPHPFP